MRLHHVRSVLLSVCLLGIGGMAMAATWDGETDNRWSTGTNWDGDVSPAVGSAVVIDDGGLANQPLISAAETFTIRSVGVSDGLLQVAGNLTATEGVTVSGGLTGGQLDILFGGNIAGTVSNSGRLGLAGTIAGNLNLLSGLASITSGAQVDGTSSLDAALFVDLAGLIFGADEIVYDVFTSGAFVGAFDSIATAGLADGYLVSSRVLEAGRFDVFQLVLTKTPLVVPEPSSLAMCLLALAAAGAVSRHGRAAVALPLRGAA